MVFTAPVTSDLYALQLCNVDTTAWPIKEKKNEYLSRASPSDKIILKAPCTMRGNSDSDKNNTGKHSDKKPAFGNACKLMQTGIQE